MFLRHCGSLPVLYRARTLITLTQASGVDIIQVWWTWFPNRHKAYWKGAEGNVWKCSKWLATQERNEEWFIFKKNCLKTYCKKSREKRRTNATQFGQIKCEKALKEEHKQCHYGARHAKSSGWTLQTIIYWEEIQFKGALKEIESKTELKKNWRRGLPNKLQYNMTEKCRKYKNVLSTEIVKPATSVPERNRGKCEGVLREQRHKENMRNKRNWWWNSGWNQVLGEEFITLLEWVNGMGEISRTREEPNVEGGSPPPPKRKSKTKQGKIRDWRQTSHKYWSTLDSGSFGYLLWHK